MNPPPIIPLAEIKIPELSSRKDFWEYDPVGNIWVQKADFGGTARQRTIGFFTDTSNCGTIYIGLGNDGSSKQDLWVYDPTTDIWSQKANFLGGPRESAVSFSINTKGYVVTGYDGTSFYQDLWEYVASSNSWIQKANFPGLPREWSAGFSVGSKGYIGTGMGTPYSKDFWEWDQATNGWTQMANFGGTARIQAVGFCIGLKGYIGLGVDSTGAIKSFYEFDPNATGINEINNENSISIYPNPFSSATTITTNKILKSATLTIYSISGQTVEQIKNDNGQTIILHRDNLPSGTYFLRLTQDNKVIAADKLVITDK